MNCPQCGIPIEDHSSFCGNCGWQLETTVRNVEPPAFATLKKPGSNPVYSNRHLVTNVIFSILTAISLCGCQMYRVSIAHSYQTGMLYNAFLAVILLDYIVGIVLLVSSCQVIRKTKSKHLLLLCLEGMQTLLELVLIITTILTVAQAKTSTVFFDKAGLLWFLVLSDILLILELLLLTYSLIYLTRYYSVNPIIAVLIAIVMTAGSIMVLSLQPSKFEKKSSVDAINGMLTGENIRFGMDPTELSAVLNKNIDTSDGLVGIRDCRVWDPTGRGIWDDCIRSSFWFDEDSLWCVYSGFRCKAPEKVKYTQLYRSLSESYGSPDYTDTTADCRYAIWLMGDTDILLLSKEESHEQNYYDVELFVAASGSLNIDNLLA